MIEIDGSQGEGGGQVVRTALALAAATGQSVRLTRIRAGRRPPGLRAQHLTAVRAVAEICDARVDGLGQAHSAEQIARLRVARDEVIGTELVFEPQRPRSGQYRFDVGTAGSACLVLQTIALPLALADGASEVELTGGTHNPRSPCFEYIQFVWLEMLRRMGIELAVEAPQAGFYPKGGGKLVCRIPGGMSPQAIRPLELVKRGELRRVECRSLVAELPIRIAHRQRAAAEHELAAAGLQPVSKIDSLPSPGAGTVCFIGLEFAETRAAFFSLGARGKAAETVGIEAAREARQFVQHDSVAALDPYAADQLMLPLALAPAPSRYSTTRITEHALTNALVIERMTQRTVRFDGPAGQAGTVRIE